MRLQSILLSTIFCLILFTSLTQAQWWVQGGDVRWPHGNVNITQGDLSLDAGELLLSSTIVGEGAFTTTAAADTTVITGALATDTYIVSGKYVAGVDQQDVLQWEAKADTLIVHRLASGESAGAYTWLRLPTP